MQKILSKSAIILTTTVGIGVSGYGLYYLFSKIPKHHDSRIDREEVREWIVGLLYPTVLGVGGYLLNEQANKRSQEEQSAQDERAKTEQKELREQSEYKYYLDRMSELAKDGLIQTDRESAMFKIAQALTENIFRELSAERMNKVISFLRSLNLTEIKTKTNPQAISVLQGIQLNNAALNNLRAYKVDFSGANLSGANLSEADLIKANLTEAHLIRTNLSGANLSGANLFNANLFGADLSGAYLNNTHLTVHLTEQQQQQCALYKPTIFEKDRENG